MDRDINPAEAPEVTPLGQGIATFVDEGGRELFVAGIEGDPATPPDTNRVDPPDFVREGVEEVLERAVRAEGVSPDDVQMWPISVHSTLVSDDPDAAGRTYRLLVVDGNGCSPELVTHLIRVRRDHLAHTASEHNEWVRVLPAGEVGTVLTEYWAQRR